MRRKATHLVGTGVICIPLLTFYEGIHNDPKINFNYQGPIPVVRGLQDPVGCATYLVVIASGVTHAASSSKLRGWQSHRLNASP